MSSMHRAKHTYRPQHKPETPPTLNELEESLDKKCKPYTAVGTCLMILHCPTAIQPRRSSNPKPSPKPESHS